MESFKQGYRLQDTDLNLQFWSNMLIQQYPDGYPSRSDYQYLSQSLPYYPPYVYSFSPYWVRYGLGYVTPNNIYHEFGPRYRIPLNLDKGTYRPNFIIGADWQTGTYEVRWKYTVEESSPILMLSVRFTVTSAGIYSGVPQYRDYHDLPAAMMVVN